MNDILLWSIGLTIGILLLVWSYRRNPIPLDEIIVGWLFASWLSILIYFWGLWEEFWFLSLPTFGTFGTLFAVWVLAYPLYNIAYASLLRQSWLWNLLLTIGMATLQTFWEYVAVKFAAVVTYFNGWNLTLTYWSYFFPLLTLWGFLRFFRYLKRIPPPLEKYVK